MGALKLFTHLHGGRFVDFFSRASADVEKLITSTMMDGMVSPIRTQNTLALSKRFLWLKTKNSTIVFTGKKAKFVCDGVSCQFSVNFFVDVNGVGDAT